MIKIRSVTEKDVRQVAELTRESCSYQERFDDVLKLASEVDWKGYVSTMMKQNNTQIFVADMERSIVGYMIVRIIGHQNKNRAGWAKKIKRKLINRRQTGNAQIILPRIYGFIEDVYVVPSMRNSLYKIGFNLYSQSLLWFKEKQVQSVELTIAMNNSLSNDFFHNLGYKPVRVLMRKKFDSL